MPEFEPVCPFCDASFDGVILSKEKSVKLTCTSCGRRYEWIPEAGCFPLEDELSVRVAQGPLGPRMIFSSEQGLVGGSSRGISTLARCIVFIAIIIVLLLLPFTFG